MKIALIGAGQQGASQGLGFILADHEVIFYDPNLARRQETCAKADEYEIAQEKIVFADTPEEAIRGADVIGANVPGAIFAQVAQQVAKFADNGAIFYDNGSGKVKTMRAIQDALGRNLERINYFGAHFFVGRSGTGPEFAAADMYEGATAAIIGPENEAQKTLIGLFRQLSVKIIRTNTDPENPLSAEDHDESLGLFSHHNTFASSALMLAFPQVRVKGQDLQFGRFLSSTRVAAYGESGHLFWGPVANDNAKAIVSAAQRFSAELDQVKIALQQNHDGQLVSYLKEAFEYVSTIRVDRDFEGLEGDLNDLEVLGCLDDENLMSSHVAMPIIFAASSAHVAKNYQESGGQKFESIDNSSFHDTLRPARDDPEKSAAFIWDHRNSVLKAVQALQHQHAIITDAICTKAGGLVQDIIERSDSLRRQLPDAPTAARPEFTLD